MGSFTRFHANDVKSQLWSHIIFPGSIPLLAGPPPPCNSDQLEPLSSCGGGGGALWRPCKFTPQQSQWSSGSTICFPSRESAVCFLGKLTMELDSTVRAVSPQYIIKHLPYQLSPIIILIPFFLDHLLWYALTTWLCKCALSLLCSSTTSTADTSYTSIDFLQCFGSAFV
jgi:hypothetical protein